MESYFGAALTAQYSRLKSSGVTLQVWMACHEKEAALILDMADAKVVLAEKDSWHEVKSQVARLSAGSLLGRTLFQAAEKQVTAASYSKIICDLLDTLKKSTVIEKTTIAKFKDDACAAVKELGAVRLGRRSIELPYGSSVHKVTLEVFDATTEWSLRLAAFLKTQALWTKNGLVLLPWETWLFLDRSTIDCTVAPAVLAHMNMAREVANQLLSVDDAEALGDLVKIYEKKKTELLCLDHSFGIEMAFVTKEAGDALDKRLREQILAVLPRSVRLVTLQQARLELESMRAQKQLRFCSGYARDHLSTAIDWLHKMQRNISPKIDAAATKDQFLRAVHGQLANFVTATVQGDAGTEPKTLCGALAMKCHFTNMTDQNGQCGTQLHSRGQRYGNLSEIQVHARRCAVQTLGRLGVRRPQEKRCQVWGLAKVL